VVVDIGETGDRMTTTNTTNKPFMIEKRRVYEAYKAVKSAKDPRTIEHFEADLGIPTVRA
jgi:RNA-directed DNA polymerase